jgi:hypothetical protein
MYQGEALISYTKYNAKSLETGGYSFKNVNTPASYSRYIRWGNAFSYTYSISLPDGQYQGYVIIPGIGNVGEVQLPFNLIVSPSLRPPPPPYAGIASLPNSEGYRLVTSGCSVYNFGAAMYYGSPIINGNTISENHCVGIVSTPDGKGYWLVTSNGTVFRYGDAKLYGMMGNKPEFHCVGMASTPDGKGYWLLTSNGVVSNFGDAISLGSEPAAVTKNTVIVGIASTPDGKGYWLTASSGQVYRFGDAENLGSVKTSPKDPVVGMAISSNGKIFQQATQHGKVYTFTASSGHTGLSQVNAYQPIVGFVPASNVMGDWLVDELGNSFTTGSAVPYDLG